MNLLHKYFHNLANFENCTSLQTIFKWEEREKSNSITRNASRSDILMMLTLLSAETKSVVALRVPSIRKVEVCNLSLLILRDSSVWVMGNFLICLPDYQKVSEMIGFILSTTCSVHLLCHRNPSSNSFS